MGRARRPGTVRASDSATGTQRELEISSPGAYPLFEHARHTEGVLSLELSGGVVCEATCFTPGLA